MTETKALLAGLTKPQKSRLSRYECGMCEQLLDRTLRYGCSSRYGRCEPQGITDRAIRCLDASTHRHIQHTASEQEGE